MASQSHEATSSSQKTSHKGEHHGDHSDGTLPITRGSYVFSICACINSCNLGFDLGATTNVGPLVEAQLGLTTAQRELFVGSLDFWAIVGGFLSNWICDKYGRRRSFITAALGFIIGSVITGASNSFFILMVGRMFVGLGIGFGLAIDPLYIAEITPAAHRGKMVTWSEIAVNIGIVFGLFTAIMFYGVADSLKWRLMLYMGALLPLVMIYLVLTVMPESPRWLVNRGRFDEAKAVLQKVYPPGFDVDAVIADIKEVIERERLADQNIGWGAVLCPTKAFRRMLMVGLGTAVAQQAVGIDSIFYYMNDLIKRSGIKSETSQLSVLMLLGCCKLVFVFVGGKLFDKLGRRPLLGASLIGMCLCLIMIAFTENVAQITGVALYLSFYSIGMGPGAWLVPSEIFATSIRAKGMSLATTLNRAVATIVASTFLTTANAMGWTEYFLMLAGICFILTVFLYVYLPETKGRSLEDMTLYFAEITNDTSILDAEATLRRNDDVEKPVNELSPLITQ
ncbi:unnamed protein product [Cylindrotheca closterium]|uniref:Hexose transporter 1 n=1 Tax=Cylindrotheca closterium TaxID=2856 RepID=A0AAD2CEJ6_9STRA|nr:unnamed protein product [Cylindrotheca closterium]